MYIWYDLPSAALERHIIDLCTLEDIGALNEVMIHIATTSGAPTDSGAGGVARAGSLGILGGRVTPVLAQPKENRGMRSLMSNRERLILKRMELGHK